MNEDVSVKFGGNTDQLDQASQKAKHDINEVTGAAGTLVNAFRQMAGVVKGSFGGEVFTVLQHHIHEVGAEAKEAGVEAIGMKEVFGMAFGGIAAALSLPALLEFGEHMGELVEKTAQLGQRIGMSAESISQWGTVMTQNGMSTETFATAATRLNRSLVLAANGSKTQAAMFASLGINAKEATNPTEVLLKLADKFHEMPDGPKKTAEAMMLLGRGGAAMIPVLNKGREAIEEQMKVGEEYGATMDENFIQKGERVAEAFNEQKLAGQGLKNMLFDEFAPTIATVVEGLNDMVKEMIQSYKEGGTVAVVLGTIDAAFKLVVTAIQVTIAGFKDLWDMGQLVLGGLLRSAITLGHAMADIMHGNVTGAWSDMKAGAGATADFINGKVDGMRQRSDKLGESLRKLWSGSDGKHHEAKEGGEAGDLTIPGMGPKGKKGGDKSRMQEWENELQKQLMAEKNFFADSKAEELAFWQSKVALTAAGSKERFAVESKVFQLTKELKKEEYAQQMEDFDYKKQLLKDDFRAQLEVENQKLAVVKAAYGENSREYTKALRERETMLRAHHEEELRLEQAHQQALLQIKQGEIDAENQIETMKLEMAKSRAGALDQMGMTGWKTRIANYQQFAQQELAIEQQHEQAMYAAKLASLQKQLALFPPLSQEHHKIASDIEIAEAEHQQKLNVLNQKGAQVREQVNEYTAQQTLQHWNNILDPFASAFDGFLNSMEGSSTSFRQALLRMGDQILQSFISMGVKVAFHWAATELAKTSATVTGVGVRTAAESTGAKQSIAISAVAALKRIAHMAAVAAAGAYAAIASIPVVGPFLAPAVAAAALFGVFKLAQSVFSAADGWGEVPYDGAQTTLHKKEMVLPAKYANPLRDMLSGAGPRGSDLSTTAANAGAAARETNNNNGTANFNYQPVHNHENASLEALLDKEGAAMRRWFRNEHRNGSLRTS